MGLSMEGKRCMMRSRSGEPPSLPMLYVIRHPPSPASVLNSTSSGKERFCPAAMAPARGRIISLDTGKQAYSSRMSKKIAAIP